MISQRNTKQKRIILEALKCADHPTATELYERIKCDNPTISRGTVFRVLSQFAESGAVNKLNLPDSPARFDAFTNPHAHARCVYCGRVFDVSDADISDLYGKKFAGGFEIYSVNIDFTGCCPECGQNKKN